MTLKDDVKKNFGNEIIQSASALMDRESVIIPLSPALDMVLFQRVVLSCLQDSQNVVKPRHL